MQRITNIQSIALPPVNGWSVVTAIIDGKVISGYSSAKYIKEV